MLPLAAANLGLGAIETAYGLYQAHQLNKQPYPTVEVTPELRNAYGRAESMASQGYTPQESGAFKSSLASSNNLAYRNAVNMAGGSLSGAIGRGIQANNIGALNKFASDDAGLHRSNMRYADSLANHIQSISNMRQQMLASRRNQAEQAAGGALRSGLNNIGGNLNMNQAFDFYKNLYSGDSVKSLTDPVSGKYKFTPSVNGNSLSSGNIQSLSSPSGQGYNNADTLMDYNNIG